ncbi:MAG: hypothetical protein M3O71_26135 [Bacteroidota bacterium]|nr:hypothetical protein [Bacteroidota bacterium]
MNKFYTLLIATFIFTGFYSCKKDTKQPIKTTIDYKALITGSWSRTKYADTTIVNGNISSSSGATNKDYTYVFKSDGTGTIFQLSTLVSYFNFTVVNPKISINVTQSYNQDGSPSNVHIIPFSLKFTTLTATELVFRKDTTTIVNGLSTRTISNDYFTKN